MRAFAARRIGYRGFESQGFGLLEIALDA